MPGLEPVEEWLAGQEERLQGSLSKAWQSLVTITVPILLSLTPAPVELKVVGALLWVSLLLNLRLLSRLAAHRTKERQQAAETAKPQRSDDSISDLEFSLLSLMYDYYPERHTREELEQKSGRPRVEVDHALMLLLRRIPKLIHSPIGGLWREGGPNPKGFILSPDGMSHVRKQRSEQDVAEQRTL